MEYAIARISTKGQMVIPQALRTDIKAGDEFLIVHDNGKFILKKLKDLSEDLIDDLRFAEQVEQTWKEREKGTFRRSSKDDFLEELRAC
ncbi:hypothetical protein AUJ68_04335 [Candidatus Woesearchaeota archaeon CG1_02_57_44]|nr:MAG: hypothetical protein AUJ68_04335 [Candidatus Woesearchaeota archaeon CG1_02_57_44]